MTEDCSIHPKGCTLRILGQVVSNSTSLANSGLPAVTNTGSTHKPKGNAHADCGGTQLNGKGIDKEIVSNPYKVDKRYRIRRERKMKEVMTEDEVKNFSNLSDERKNEILHKVQEIVEKITME